jgi:hypothetical protein
MADKPRLSVALTRDVSPCKGCIKSVAKPQCHDWCWEYWKWLKEKKRNEAAKKVYEASRYSKKF